MKCAIFTYGKFSKEYGGQCDLLAKGLIKNKISPIKLATKKNNSILKYLFYILGLRSGFMFTGFGYKSELPKNLIDAKVIISFAQILPWNLFFYSFFKKKRIIFWNDMPIDKVAKIYVSNLIWQKLIIFIGYMQKFFLNHKIIATNYYQFRELKKVSIVPRIIDDCFYHKPDNKILTKKNFVLILIGNDFERKKFSEIIVLINQLFLEMNLKINTYVVGKGKDKLKLDSFNRVNLLGKKNKKDLSKFLKKLNLFFTVSISESEGAPITLLEVQAANGFSLCSKKNGGKEYVPEECTFEGKTNLKKIIKKIINSRKFRSYLKKKSFMHLQKNKAKNIAKEIINY